MTADKNNSLIPFLFSRNELSVKNSASDITRAIEEFSYNAPSVPAERLYTAYRTLKDMIDSMGPDFSSQSSHFNDVFLRILEDRGDSGSGIYRSVLRDSSEFRFLSGIFIKDDLPLEEKSNKRVKTDAVTEAPPAKVTLVGILADRGISILDFSETEWDALIEEHFAGIAEEKALVKNGSAVLGRIAKRNGCLDYHIVSIVEYLFSRLKGYKNIDISSKEYAMKLMNMISSKGETWSRLHREYLEIIKK